MARVLVALLGAAALAALVLAWRLLPPSGPEVPAQGFVLENVTLVVPGIGRLPDRTLVVRAGRIDSLEAATPGEGRFAGRYVLPGLIDLHVHHPPGFALGERELFALLFVAHGVTSVRDTGVTSSSLAPLRDRIAQGRVAGPRLFSCDRILDGDPPGWPAARVVTSPDEARDAVAATAAAGADCAKVYNGLSVADVVAAQREARAREIPLVAHVPFDASLGDFRDAEIQHLMGMAEVWEDLADARIEHYVRTSVRNRLAHTPTLVTFARAARLADGEANGDGVGRLLPPHYRELFWRPDANPLVWALLPGGARDAHARVAGMSRAIVRLHQAGVPILAGTDTLNPFVVPGAALHEELALLAAAGLGPEEALAAATVRAGRALGVPGLGRLEPGSPADLIVLRDDPTLGLEALATLEAVAVDGRLYTRAPLEQALERRRAHFESDLVRGVWSAISRAVRARLRSL